MSYIEKKKEFGRQLVVICEIQLDKCGLSYGVAPCMASGTSQCFNTLATCQDTTNYDPQKGLSGFVIRMSNIRVDGMQQPGQTPVFPVLMSADTAPTRLEPGKGLGIRSSVSVDVMDFPWTDVITDPYRNLRAPNTTEVSAVPLLTHLDEPILTDLDEPILVNSVLEKYDAERQGSFFGRLLARNLHYTGRPMILRTGYLDENGCYDPDNFVSRLYTLDRISGPDANGRVTLQGRDPLKAADNDRAQWPRPTAAELQGSIDETVGTFFIVDPGAAISASWAAGQPWIRIDDEIMEITVAAHTSGVTEVVVNRATLPAMYTGSVEAEEHEAEAKVQLCYLFDNVRVDDIIYLLLNSAANVDASFLPTAQWDAIVDDGLQSYSFSTLLVEPTGVKTLLEELTNHTILLWWDEREQLVKMDSLIQRTLDLGPLTDDIHLVDGSVAVTRDERSRISQTWLYYAMTSPLASMTEGKSYSRVEVVADLDAEAPESFGDTKVAEIKSRWLPLALRAVAGEIAVRHLNNYKIRKTVISCSLDPKDDTLWTGDRVLVETRYVQDFFGAPLRKGYMILQAEERISDKGVTYEYVMSEQPGLIRTGVITPDENPEAPPQPFPDYTDASAALKSRYMFIGYDDGSGPPPVHLPFPDGADPYKII